MSVAPTPTTDSNTSTGPTDRPVLRHVALPAAVMLAIYVIVHALLLSRFPWFVDETFFAVTSQGVQGDPASRFAALGDHKGLINTWIGAVLIRGGIPPMDAMRLISVAAGITAAGATGWVVGRWRSISEGLVAATLVAFIPYMLVHDSLGVYDAFITGGSMVALVLQISLAARPRLDRSMLLGVTWGLLLLSKPTGAIAVALVPFSLLVFDWRAPGVRRRLAAWVSAVFLALVIALAMYALTRLSPLAYSPAPDNHRTLSDLFSDPFGTLGTIAPDAARAMLGYLSWPGVALAIWGAIRVVWQRDRFGVLIVIWAAAALAAFLLLTDNAYPRYGLQAVPPLCALMVVGGGDLWGRARQRFSLRVVASVAFVLALQALVLDVRVLAQPKTAPYPGLDRAQYVTLVSNRQPAREAGELILQRSPAIFSADTPAAQRTIADLGGWSWATTLSINGTKWTATPRFAYIDQNAPHDQVNAARFVIVEGAAPDWLDVRGATLVRRWTNPDGGPTTLLYDRGV